MSGRDWSPTQAPLLALMSVYIFKHTHSHLMLLIEKLFIHSWIIWKQHWGVWGPGATFDWEADDICPSSVMLSEAEIKEKLFTNVFVGYMNQNMRCGERFFIMFVFVCSEDEGVIDYCPKEKYKRQTFLQRQNAPLNRSPNVKRAPMAASLFCRKLGPVLWGYYFLTWN